MVNSVKLKKIGNKEESKFKIKAYFKIKKRK
jgi:hypothetical protein